jgi:hypothetical protein
LIEQVIEVASSSFSGDLCEYLLLLAGSFNHRSIHKAALENGATILEHDGVSLLAISPFQREQQQFNRARWLAILDEKILVFGTPAMVRNALDRYLHNEQTDPIHSQHANCERAQPVVKAAVQAIGEQMRFAEVASWDSGT